MIIYSATKQQFIKDVKQNDIDERIQSFMVRETGHRVGESEQRSFRNSLPYMRNIVDDSAIPDDVGILIEYKIPKTNNRIDFIVTGRDEDNRDRAVLVELKQWSDVELTDMDGMVRAFVSQGAGVKTKNHPSYQVWSYAMLLNDFNESVEEFNIGLQPCVYMHNCTDGSNIRDGFYKEYLDKAPVYLRNDVTELQNFVKSFIKQGDKNSVVDKIEHGRIRPSKQLAQSLSSMLKGNHEFTLIDEQKSVYEIALKLSREATDEVKNVLIVEGGPGTGKSVIAINLLNTLVNLEQNVRYVTKNAAPRQVYQAMLTGSMTKSRIASLFASSDAFYQSPLNELDVLVIDEAHRLREHSGLFNNQGENQIKELINAAKCSIFFLDEDQRVTMSDIGDKDEIKHWARSLGAQVTEMKLESQFRCNGSDGYLAWLDNILNIHDTANVALSELDYDFQVVDSPKTMKEMIVAKNDRNKSRLVAGYCWKWPSANDPKAYDIEIGNFKAQWNLKSHGQAWIIQPNSIDQVGCIHTCQGLELDYVGVIIGPDLVVRDGTIVTDATKRSPTDTSVRGYKKLLKSNPEQAKIIGDRIVKNTYRTLMTRGMKGCYVYSTDPETQEYFKRAMEKPVERKVYEFDDGGEVIT